MSSGDNVSDYIHQFSESRGDASAYTLSTMLPHQLEGLSWLWSLHNQGKGGILGDESGLGKTVQICGFLAELFHLGLIKRALIVTEKTLLSIWFKELSDFGLAKNIREYSGSSQHCHLQYVLKEKGFLLSYYDAVRINSDSLSAEIWDYLILDEGHRIKNPKTKVAKSLHAIPSVHRIIITGTPIDIKLEEMWALFNFCCPELLGNYKWFRERFEVPILRGNNRYASEKEKCIGRAAEKDLKELIQPFFLRRSRSEVLNTQLPKKHEVVVWLRMTNCAQRIYAEFLNSDIGRSACNSLPMAAILIVKKICNHPLLLKKAAEGDVRGMDSNLNAEDNVLAEKIVMLITEYAKKDDFQKQHDNISCKISFILRLLDKLIPEGHNILIFSESCDMLDHIQGSVDNKGYKFLRLDGNTKNRHKIISDFQGGDVAPILFLTSRVGGHGLTLTKADRVILVEPAWNISIDDRSISRAYQIGQQRDVLVYRLMTCGTVEENMYRKQICEHEEVFRSFNQQDLRELLSFPKQGFDISLTQRQLHEEHGDRHMDESLEAHIQFLETLGIAGVSQHSLLSKTAPPVQVVQEEAEETGGEGSMFAGKSSPDHTVIQERMKRLAQNLAKISEVLSQRQI